MQKSLEHSKASLIRSSQVLYFAENIRNIQQKGKATHREKIKPHQKQM